MTKLILNIGSGHISKNTELKALRVDIDRSTDPDIIASVYKLPFKDNSVDGVILTSVLEHLEKPQEAVNEIYRVLKKNAFVIGFTPFLYPYHAKEKHYKDYYRYTKDGLKYLFRNYTVVKLHKYGYLETLVYMLPLKGFWRNIARKLDNKFKIKSNITYGYRMDIKK